MNPVRLAVLLVCLLSLAGCANALRAPVRPPGGFLYTGYDAPLTTNFLATPKGSKTGQSATLYLRIPLIFVNPDFAWADGGIQRAAQNGGITTIYYADYHYTTVLGIFARFTVTVHGD